MKRLVSLMLVFMIVILNFGAVFAESKFVTEKISDEETLYHQFSQTYSKAQIKKYIQSLELVKIENSKDEKGMELTHYYYKPNFKKTKEAKEMKNFLEIKRNEKGLDKYSDDSTFQIENTELILPMSIVPEEGDFRVTVGKGDLDGKDFFDNLLIYQQYLYDEAKYTFAHLSAYIVSNPVYNYLTNSAIDLIEAGHKGDGDAYSRKRRVHKWGEIYHNGRWIDYYYGYQDEIYWRHIYDVYSQDEDNYGEQIYTHEEIYEPATGNGPIYWEYNDRFRDNDLIYEIALEQYRNNGYVYHDVGTNKDWSSDWDRGPDTAY